MLLAQAAAAGAVTAPPATPPPTSASAAAADLRQCSAANDDPNSRQIIVCAPRPQGYRIDPDVLAAKRMKKKGDPGQARNPHETFVDHSCATVGPMGCRGGPVIDIATAAMTAATMVDKAAKGENVGKMWVTDPQRGEYQLYLDARREREAKEKEKAAKAAQAKAAAAATSTSSAGSR
jgi:hypothetical protein